MTTTLSDLRTSVREETGEDSTFFTDAFVDDAIEEALYDVGEKIEVFGRRIISLRKGITFYSIKFSDIMKAPSRAYFIDTSLPMDTVSIRQLDEDFGWNWQNIDSARPDCMFVMGMNLIGFYPRPSNEGIEVAIEYPRAPIMPGSANEIMEFPDYLQDDIVKASVQWLKFPSGDKQFLESIQARKDYTDGRDNMAGMVDKDNKWLL